MYCERKVPRIFKWEKRKTWKMRELSLSAPDFSNSQRQLFWNFFSSLENIFMKFFIEKTHGSFSRYLIVKKNWGLGKQMNFFDFFFNFCQIFDYLIQKFHSIFGKFWKKSVQVFQTFIYKMFALKLLLFSSKVTLDIVGFLQNTWTKIPVTSSSSVKKQNSLNYFFKSQSSQSLFTIHFTFFFVKMLQRESILNYNYCFISLRLPHENLSPEKRNRWREISSQII